MASGGRAQGDARSAIVERRQGDRLDLDRPRAVEGPQGSSAAQGASLRELMERMGHSSPRAALIYLHATRERDRKIASGMGALFTNGKKTGGRKVPIGRKRSSSENAA